MHNGYECSHVSEKKTFSVAVLIKITIESYRRHVTDKY